MSRIMLNTAEVDSVTLKWLTGQIEMDGDWVDEMTPVKIKARDNEGKIQVTDGTVITFTKPFRDPESITVVGSKGAVAALLGVD